MGQYVRVCVRFTDNDGNPEDPLCSVPARILNVNDAPASDGFTVDVFISASSADPFFFGPDLFQFTDEDVDVNDQLQSITITDAPDNGTLRSGTGNDATVVSDGQLVLANAIAQLNYYPETGQVPTPGYATIMFTVSDGLASSTTYEITINLVQPSQTAAAGAPTVAASDASQAAFDEDVELSAVIDGSARPQRHRHDQPYVAVAACRQRWHLQRHSRVH